MDQQTLDTAQLPRRVYTAHILMNFKIKINKDYLRIFMCVQNICRGYNRRGAHVARRFTETLTEYKFKY